MSSRHLLITLLAVVANSVTEGRPVAAKEGSPHVVKFVTRTTDTAGGNLAALESKAVTKASAATLEKTWRNAGSKNEAGSQVLTEKHIASRVCPKAEGMGFEPTTPCGAPDFESGR